MRTGAARFGGPREGSEVDVLLCAANHLDHGLPGGVGIPLFDRLSHGMVHVEGGGGSNWIAPLLKNALCPTQRIEHDAIDLNQEVVMASDGNTAVELIVGFDIGTEVVL